MYSVDSLEYAVRHLFQGGIGEHGYSEEGGDAAPRH